MFTDVHITAKYSISSKKSFDAVEMKSTDTIRSFMQKVIKKPKNYDCLIFLESLKLLGILCLSNSFLQIGPKIQF